MLQWWVSAWFKQKPVMFSSCLSLCRCKVILLHFGQGQTERVALEPKSQLGSPRTAGPQASERQRPLTFILSDCQLCPISVYNLGRRLKGIGCLSLFLQKHNPSVTKCNLWSYLVGIMQGRTDSRLYRAHNKTHQSSLTVYVNLKPLYFILPLLWRKDRAENDDNAINAF